MIKNRQGTDDFIPDFFKVFLIFLVTRDTKSYQNRRFHNSFVESVSSISFFEHELPTLEKNAMSYCVAFTRDLYAIAVPYSRGGRSEAQQNKQGPTPKLSHFNVHQMTVK